MPIGYDNYFQPDPNFHRYTISPVAGYSTGNPIFDQALMMMLGQHASPRPLPGTNQSIYDAYRMRDRNLDFMMARNTAFANSLMVQRMGGVNTQGGLFQALSPLIADPDGIAMRFMSPLQGGNPVRAQMGLFANLTGQTAGALGMTGNVSVAQTTDMMNSLYKQIYRERRIDYAPRAGEDPSQVFSLNEFRRNSIKRVYNMLGSDDEMARDFVDSFNEEGRRSFQQKYGTEYNKDFGRILDRASKKLTGISDSGEIQKIKDEASAAADEFLKKITDPDVKNTMQQAFKEAIEKGSEGANQFKERFSADNARIVDMLRTFERFERRIGETIPVSIDFKTTRGFQIEDITGGFTTAADTFLTSKKGYTRGLVDFTKNGLGVLDAARGVFGNDKSGKELTLELSRLLGNSFVDLSDSTESKKLEDLLRNVKAAARTAGVSIESILGIIEEGRMLSQGRIGGTALMGMAGSVMDNTTVMTQLMGNDYMRRNGGTVGVAQKLMAGEIQAMNEPITQRAAALYEMFAQQGNTTATGMIDEYIKNGDTTRSGFNAFVNQLAKATGKNVFSLQQFAATAPEVSELGIRRNPALGNLGKSSAVQSFERMMRRQYGSAGIHALELAFGGGDVSLADILSKDPQLTKEQIDFLTTVDARAQKGPMGLDEFRALVGLHDPSGFTQYMAQNGYELGLRQKYSPTARALFEQQQAFTTESARIDADMAAKMPYLNAPIVQGMFQKLLDGSIGEEGLTSMLDVLKDNSPEYKLMKRELTAIQELNDVSKRDAIGGLGEYYQKTMGMTTGQINELMKVGKTFSIEELHRIGRMDDSKAKAFIKGRGFSLDQVRSAYKTLTTIDSAGRMTGNISEDSFIKFSKERGLERFVEAQYSSAIKEQDKLAAKRYKDMLEGKGLQAFASKDESKEQIQSGLQTISERLEKFGVFKDGQLNAEQYARLSEGNSEEAHKFQAEIASMEKDGSGVSSTALRILRDNVMGDRNSRVAGYKAPVEALIQGKEQEKKMESVLEGLQKLVDVLGSGFSKDLIPSITNLTAAVNSLGVNN